VLCYEIKESNEVPKKLESFLNRIIHLKRLMKEQKLLIDPTQCITREKGGFKPTY
jgi:hypothetical protein